MAIANFRLGTILKNLSLAAVLAIGLAQTAKADETNKHQNLRIACDPAINQNSRLNCSFNNLTEMNEDTVAQGSRGRRRKSKVQGYYGGFSLGIISPSGGLELTPTDGLDISSTIDYSTGFAGGVFGGINFSEKIGAELEFLIGTGSGDADDFNQEYGQEFIDPLFQTFADDLINQAIAETPEAENLPDGALDITAAGGYELEADYTIFALYASPRFNLPVSDKFKVFVSPGIGIAQTNVTTEVNFSPDLEFSSNLLTPEQLDEVNSEARRGLEEEDIESNEVDLSQTGISFQIKAGAEYQISNSINVFGQFRYATLPTEDSNEFEIDDLNSFLGQAGLTFNF